MDDDFAKFMTIIIVAGLFAIGFEIYLKHVENLKAIESGYIQIIENNHVLWKKEVK